MVVGSGVASGPLVLSASCMKLNFEFGVKLPMPAPELKWIVRFTHSSAQGVVVRWLPDPAPELVQVFEDVMPKIFVYETRTAYVFKVPLVMLRSCPLCEPGVCSLAVPLVLGTLVRSKIVPWPDALTPPSPERMISVMVLVEPAPLVRMKSVVNVSFALFSDH